MKKIAFRLVAAGTGLAGLLALYELTWWGRSGVAEVIVGLCMAGRRP